MQTIPELCHQKYTYYMRSFITQLEPAEGVNLFKGKPQIYKEK